MMRLVFFTIYISQFRDLDSTARARVFLSPQQVSKKQRSSTLTGFRQLRLLGRLAPSIR